MNANPNKISKNVRNAQFFDTIVEFEPSIEGETVTVPRETRQCSTTCCKTGQDILGNDELAGLTPPAVLSRRCSFRLPLVSTDGTGPGPSAFPLLGSQKMDRFLDRRERRIVFSRWYPTIARKEEKVVASDGLYFESLVGNHVL